MRPGLKLIALATLATTLSLPATAIDRRVPASREAVDELEAHDARVITDPATGAPRLVRIPPGSLQLEGADPKSKAMDFFVTFGEAFGIEDPTGDLELVKNTEDQLGMTHLSFAQIYEGVPVFGARVVAHFDRRGELVTVNGAVVPDIELLRELRHDTPHL